MLSYTMTLFQGRCVSHMCMQQKLIVFQFVNLSSEELNTWCKNSTVWVPNLDNERLDASINWVAILG